MGERARSLALRSVPWREGVGWPVVAVEGVALLAVGLFMVLRPDDAADVTRTLLGAALLIISLQQVVNGFRNPGHSFVPFQMLRGGIGATVGLLVGLMVGLLVGSIADRPRQRNRARERPRAEARGRRRLR